MYIYELPFEINNELCRMLDADDTWKELAGRHMKYTAYDVDDIEQTAQRLNVSPTSQLFTRWGQQNHKVGELFILLYRMKHTTSLHCLAPIMESKYLQLLRKQGTKPAKEKVTTPVGNVESSEQYALDSANSALPVQVKLIVKGILPLPPSHEMLTETSCETETDSSRNTSHTDGRLNSSSEEQIKKMAAIPRLSYEDLKEATGNWNEAFLLGKGGFGQVYKGVYKYLPLAVKRLRDNDGKNQELIREMVLNQYRHDNILPLYGYSLGGPEVCLVYQLMAGGSLDQRLKCKTFREPLTWGQRLRVAHGVARGLTYLHTMEGTPLIHGDIKPANILLDQCSMPKIGDFGLARKGPYGDERTHLKVSRVHGTLPYLPDEYLRSGCLSPSVDVYSFGVVALETATNLPASDKERPQKLLRDLVHQRAKHQPHTAMLELEDPVLRSRGSCPELTREFVSLGLAATRHERRERPDMLALYKRLDALAAVWAHIM